ncbi:MAG: prepilin-type N-terminal cleavage/methylation domain-containing protein [Deltaproteobacteria bacterium]|nr:prepilin-type N-terminal cleavage/methylation domain-containing protein [Deltaproteobacteria bacterium]
MLTCRMKKISAAGFTFLEVMVAVAIIAIALVTLIGSQSQSVSIAGEARFDIMASLLAQQKLTEIEAGNFDSLFSDEGDFGKQYPDYRWHTVVQSLGEDETGLSGTGGMLKAVDLTVTRTGDARSSYIVRDVVMADPKE